MSDTNFYPMGYFFFQHKTTSKAIPVKVRLYKLLIKYCTIIPIKMIFKILTGILIIAEKPLPYSLLEY